MKEQPPKKYMDGCTMFFNKLGSVSHRHICDQHDKDYWNYRTVPGKIVADNKWAGRLIKVHFKENTIHWKIISIPVALIGWAGLMTGGWYFWWNRHKFDKPE